MKRKSSQKILTNHLVRVDGVLDSSLPSVDGSDHQTNSRGSLETLGEEVIDVFVGGLILGEE